MKKLLFFICIFLSKLTFSQTITIDAATFPFAACSGQNITVNFTPAGGATGPFTVELIENFSNQGGQFCGPPVNASTVKTSVSTSTNSASFTIPSGLFSESGGGPPTYCNFMRWYEIKVYNSSVSSVNLGITLFTTCTPVMAPKMSPVSICSGKSIDVKWMSSGANVANIYTVELSGINGNFTTPTTLGTLIGSNTDGLKTLTVTTPAGLVSGQGHLVKVKSSNPVNEKTFALNLKQVSECGPVQAIIVPASLCSGATSTVSYTLDDVFQAGNVFTAELSNQSGSFASPTTIGSITSQTATSFPITLPVNLTHSGGYYVRIIASLPSLGSPYTSPNSSNIQIGLPTPLIYLNPSNVCENGQISLELSTSSFQPEANYTFVWNKNGTNVNALNQSTSPQTNYEYFLRTPPQNSDAGIYSVTVSRNSDACAATSNTTNVTIAPAPSPPTTSPITVISGNTASLTASGCAGSLTWYSSITGNSVNSTTPELTQQTTYYVSCQASTHPYCISTRTPLVISVDATNAPNAPILTASDNNFCAGSVTNPKITAAGCTGIVRWYFRDIQNTSFNLMETDNVAPFEYNISNGTSRVYAADCRENNVLSTTRSELTVTVKPVPSSPSLDPNYLTINSGSNVLHNIYSSNCLGGIVNWYDASTGGNLLFTGSPYNITNVTSNYGIFASCTINGCESTSRSSGSVNVQTSGVASPGFFANPSEICGSGTATLTALGCTQGIVNWFTFANSIYTSVGTGQTFSTPSLAHTGSNSSVNFQYYADCTIGPTTSSKTSKTIYVYKAPTTPSANQPTIACNTSATLTATNCSSSNNFYLRWYETANATTWINSGTTFTTPNLSATTIYYLECYNSSSSSCASIRVPITVTVGCTPPAAPLISSNLTTVCGGTGINLSATGCANTVNWSDGGVGAIRNNVIFNTSVSLTATCNNGQSSANSNTLNIVVNPKPNLVITNPAPLSPPNTINITLAAVTLGSTLHGGHT
jgi:Ig-like domain CHU_C associated